MCSNKGDADLWQGAPSYPSAHAVHATSAVAAAPLRHNKICDMSDVGSKHWTFREVTCSRASHHTGAALARTGVEAIRTIQKLSEACQ